MRATLVVSIDRLGVVNALVDDVREVLGLSLIAGVEYCGNEILEVESLGSLAEDSGDDCSERLSISGQFATLASLLLAKSWC